MPKEIARGKLVRCSRKPNGGKAEALNFALEHASTKSSTSASMPILSSPPMRSPNWFRTSKIPKVGAVAGNAKVGNRVNLVDPLAGSRIHHQPELRTPRTRSLQRRHGRSRSYRRMAHRCRPRRRRLPRQHRRRRCRPHHEPARAGVQGRSTKIAHSPSLRLPSTRTASCASASAGPSEFCRRSSNTAWLSCATRPWASSRCPTSSSSRCFCRSSRRSST